MENNQPPVSGNDTVNPKGNNHPVNQPEQGTPKKKKLSARQIFMIILIALVILLPLGVYWFMNLEMSKLKVRQGVEMDTLKTQASDMISKNNRFHLETVAQVFAWSARTEIMHNDVEHLNQMMTSLVKIKGYRQVVLLSDAGAVVLSTDKKFEGKEYSDAFYRQLAGSDQVQMNVQKNGDLLVSAPVLGMDKRLGSVVITFTPEPVNYIQPAPIDESKIQE